MRAAADHASTELFPGTCADRDPTRIRGEWAGDQSFSIGVVPWRGPKRLSNQDRLVSTTRSPDRLGEGCSSRAMDRISHKWFRLMKLRRVGRRRDGDVAPN